MRVKSFVMLSLVLCALTGIAAVSYAAVGDMIVEFKDSADAAVCNSLTATNATSLTIAPAGGVFTCSNGTITIKIRPALAGAARVEVLSTTNETTQDDLRLVNSLIKNEGTGTVTGFHIIVKRIHSAGPTTPPTHYYKHEIKARISRVNGNYFSSQAYVTNPLSPPNEVQISAPVGTSVNNCTVMCGPNYYIPFYTEPKVQEWPSSPNLGGDRELKVNLQFTLGVNSTLDIRDWDRLVSQPFPDPAAHLSSSEEAVTCVPSSDRPKRCVLEECSEKTCIIPKPGNQGR